MKYLLFTIIAITLAFLSYLGLFHAINQEAVNTIDKNEQVAKIEFVDIEYDQSECHAVTEQIHTLLNKPQTCNTAADCAIAHFGCPFGCQSNVNVTNQEDINTLISSRNQLCNEQCKYRCMSDGVKKIPACINNLCSSTETIEPDKNIRKFLKNNG